MAIFFQKKKKKATHFNYWKGSLIANCICDQNTKLSLNDKFYVWILRTFYLVEKAI